MGTRKHKPLTGKAADDFVDEVNRRNAKQMADETAKGKAEAEQQGKEPFDLEKLEGMVYTGNTDGIQEPVERRRPYLEYLYYVANPSMMTLAEFADYIDRTRY